MRWTGNISEICHLIYYTRSKDEQSLNSQLSFPPHLSLCNHFQFYMKKVTFSFFSYGQWSISLGCWKLEGESGKITPGLATIYSRAEGILAFPTHHLSRGHMVLSVKVLQIWEAEEDFLNAVSWCISSPKQQAFTKCQRRIETYCLMVRIKVQESQFLIFIVNVASLTLPHSCSLWQAIYLVSSGF